MATYSYTHEYNLTFGAGYGRIEYNCSLAPGTKIVENIGIIVSGRIILDGSDSDITMIKLNTVRCSLHINGSQSSTSVSINITKKGVWAAFTVTVPNDYNKSYFTNRITKMTVSLGVEGTFKAEGNDTLYNTNDLPTSQEDIYFFVEKYPLACGIPSDAQPIFERTDTSGASKNDGNRITCRLLKLTLNSEASASDVTKKTISITAEGSSSPLNTVTLSDTQLSAMLSSTGYKESTPTLFPSTVIDLGKEYYIDITVGDDYDQSTFRYTVSRAFCLVDFARKKKGGFAVGMYSNSTDDYPLFEVDESHESRFYSEAKIENGALHGGTNITGINSYLEGEHLTGGTWIDGKPIYRFIWTGTTKLSGAQGVICTLPDGSNFGTVISLRAMFDRASGAWFPMPNTYYSNANNWAANIRTQPPNQILAGLGTSYTGTHSIIVFAEYTKADTSSDPPLPGPEIMAD